MDELGLIVFGLEPGTDDDVTLEDGYYISYSWNWLEFETKSNLIEQWVSSF